MKGVRILEIHHLHASHRAEGSGGCADWQGKLPACAPLANPYVPFQMVNSERYDAPNALIRGTLYPGLDLPYCGMVNTQEKNGTPLGELQSLGFAMHELGLYLDTHQYDEEAVSLFNQYAEMYEAAVQQYEQNGGVLMQSRSAQSGCYEWLENPWPWDYKEG